MQDQTTINHFHLPPLAEDNRPLVSPIYQSVKFTFNSMAEVKKLFGSQREGFFYSRYSNPTVEELIQLLAKLQGTESGIATASGVAAIFTCLFSLLKSGDRVVYFIESYKPTRIIIDDILKKFGVVGVRLSLDDHDGIQEAFDHPDTKLCIMESPTNPQLKIADLDFITQHAKSNDVLTILDNTFAGFHKNHQYPIDIYIHSLTKYANGHGDSMGGAILANQEMIRRLFNDAAEFGATLDPHAAYLILRGMKTYPLRYERQAANAARIAAFLREHSGVDKVYYPDARDSKDNGTVVTFSLKDKTADIDPILDSLELFTLSASLGSNESLVAPVLYFYGTDLSSEEKAKAGIDSTTIRLSLGIEDCDDLLKDLARSLSAIG